MTTRTEHRLRHSGMGRAGQTVSDLPTWVYDVEDLDSLVLSDRGIERVTLLDNGDQDLVAYPLTAGQVLVTRPPTIHEVQQQSYWDLAKVSSELDACQFPMEVKHVSYSWGLSPDGGTR
ncbi:hypothetical protein [Promicromonospora sp. NFX87]|uniref:hypothetical protein n=1 Tax=Promicromonospora sp. NFX87 TaxID=3402691 RepID=UPI003AFA17B6